MQPSTSCCYGVLFATVLALTSCGTTKLGRYIDPELAVYVESFEQRYGVKYTGHIYVDKIEDKYAGLCTISFSGRIIRINTSYFNNYDNDAREQVVYHELGHCLMNLEHNNNIKDGCPESIMYFQVFGNGGCYKHRKEYYHQELEDAWRK